MSSTSKSETNASQKFVRCSMDDRPLIDSSIINVLVGSAERPYAIHKNLLEAISLFFMAALSGNWKEKEENTVKLPDHEPEDFGIYAKWLYAGRIFMSKSGDIYKTKNKQTGETIKNSLEYSRWGRLYMLGDFLQDIDFKDAIVDAMIDLIILDNSWPSNLSSKVYPYSTMASPHRKFVVDVFSRSTEKNLDNMRNNDLPSGFLVDLILAKNSKKDDKNATNETWLKPKNACDYHEHTMSGFPCYKTKRNY